MVNVSDDGEISKLGHDGSGWIVRKRERSLPQNPENSKESVRSGENR